MRRSFVVLLVLATIVGCKSSSGSSSSEQGKSDSELIQGEWTVVSALTDGEDDPRAKDNKLVITSDKLTFKDLKRPDKDEEAGYKIDPSKDPKDLDFDVPVTGQPTHKATSGSKRSGSVEVESSTTHEVIKGIYSLEGDTLKICMGKNPDSPRPTEMSGKKGTKTMLITLKREK
jgi:uncharacterized protein (TIGR03067 family)